MTNEQVLKRYVSLGRKLKRFPSVSDLLAVGISRAMVRHHFGNITLLQKLANRQLKFKSRPKNMLELFADVANG